MSAPSLFVIAGPNGSGKSLFSAGITQIKNQVFDGDKHLAILQKSYPEIGSDVLLERVHDDLFISAKHNAIQAYEDFAFETNFAADNPLVSVNEFKDAGYKAYLIFMGMNSVEECIQRVSIRVSKGGHKVSETSVIYNFETGYKNLYRHYSAFDSVTLIHNPIAVDEADVAPIKLLELKKQVLLLEPVQLPHWAVKFVNTAQS